MIADILALGGALLTLLAAIGVIRFPDVLTRMHALTKASTIGLLFVVIAGVVALDDRNDYTFVLVAGALQLLTLPVGANLISRATYLQENRQVTQRRRRGSRSGQRSEG